MMPLALGGGQMPMPSAPAVQLPMAPALNAGVLDMQQGGGAGALHQGLKRPPAPSPFAAIAQPLSNAGVALPGLALPGGGDKPAPPKSSPFAVTNVMETLTESFPNFPPGQHQQAGGGERGQQGRFCVGLWSCSSEPGKPHSGLWAGDVCSVRPACCKAQNSC